MIKNIHASMLLFLCIMSTNTLADTERWYSEEDLTKGNSLFQNNCATCHKQNAEGTKDWKNRDANGFLPPPPLNGSAHAWHHDKALLQKIIREGGASYKGRMPAFSPRLNTEEINQIIAYFQSKWPEEVYKRWADNYLNSSNELPSINDLLGARTLQILNKK